MPFLAALAPLFATLAPIATVAGAGVGIGDTIYNALQGGGNQQQNPTSNQPTAAANVASATQNRQVEGAQVANQIPNIIANTSGSLSGLSDQTFGSQQSGQPGAFGQGGFDLSKIMDYLGMSNGANGAGGSSGADGSGSGPQNPTDLMALATGGIT